MHTKVIDPPKLCPACGCDVLDPVAPCLTCSFRQSRDEWDLREFPQIQRAAIADGATSIAVAIVLAVPAVLFAVLQGTSAGSGAWVGWVFAALFGMTSAVFALVGVERLRAAALPVLWSYASEGLTVTSSFVSATQPIRLRGRRQERWLLTVNARWSQVEPSNANATALVRWLNASNPPIDEAVWILCRRYARCALAVARLAAVGAVQVVVQRVTSWERGSNNDAPALKQTVFSLARGHATTPDRPSWALERRVLDALAATLASDEAALAPTPEAVHYREQQLREGALRTVVIQEVFAWMVRAGDYVVAREALIDSAVNEALEDIAEPDAPEDYTLFDVDRALIAQAAGAAAAALESDDEDW